MMKNTRFGVLLALCTLLILILPVSAQDPVRTFTVSKTCDPACQGHDFNCYIHAEYNGPGDEDALLVDYIVSGGTITQADSGGVFFTPTVVYWYLPDVQPSFTLDRTVTIRPSGIGLMYNQVGSWIGPLGTDPETGYWTVGELKIFEIDVKDTCPTPSPEFPSLFIPLTIIIGFIGSVLLIKAFRD